MGEGARRDERHLPPWSGAPRYRLFIARPGASDGPGPAAPPPGQAPLFWSLPVVATHTVPAAPGGHMRVRASMPDHGSALVPFSPSSGGVPEGGLR